MSVVGQDDPPAVMEVFDPSMLLERIGGDMSLFVELAQMFLEDYPPLVDRIRRTIADNDIDGFTLAVHTLRGSIGNFTVGQPYELAKQLELMPRTNPLSDTPQALDSLVGSVRQLAGWLEQWVARPSQ